ncbi:hydrolase [Actinoplanes italicus]|nr:hydrolase [Actinoplanes italicus]
MCSVFAGYPAPQVAAELVDLLAALDAPLTEEVRNDPDPMAIIRWAGQNCAHKVIAAIEDALTAAEVQAVTLATPTPYGHELIVGAATRGIPVAVVSNNSAAAVAAYLAAHNLTRYVSPIVGRAYAAPDRMKPEPGPVLEAAHVLRAEPASCTLVGDSASDIEAARAAGTRVIGYANYPWKVAAFTDADAVVTSMRELAEIWHIVQ